MALQLITKSGSNIAVYTHQPSTTSAMLALRAGHVWDLGDLAAPRQLFAVVEYPLPEAQHKREAVKQQEICAVTDACSGAL